MADKKAARSSASGVTRSSTLVELPNDDQISPQEVSAGRANNPTFPELYTSAPPIHDNLVTETSKVQDETVRECLPYLEGKIGDLNTFGIPQLRRGKHIRFLRQTIETLPEDFVVLDASRPWLVYWATAGLGMLGVEYDEEYRAAVVDTFRACQNESGGFGGGDGQYSHLACSYAAVLSLVAVGGEEALELVDRRAMWGWLCRMKQPDGGFTMCAGGEEDVRGAFCAMVIASLLNLPLVMSSNDATRASHQSLDSGLAEWITRCQTIEGGIAAFPGNEAHSAYAFCALGCLCILGSPSSTIPAHLDLPLLFSWLAYRQYAPEGGFAGRTNKLVDGCYSHWVGGCWALLEAAMEREGLWDREGLIRYILCCCQGDKGGLRDKPSKPPDGYHTCYNLAGLSWAQYHHVWTQKQERTDTAMPLEAAFAWEIRGEAKMPIDEEDRVEAAHPIFVIPPTKVMGAKEYFEGKVGF